MLAVQLPQVIGKFDPMPHDHPFCHDGLTVCKLVIFFMQGCIQKDVNTLSGYFLCTLLSFQYLQLAASV
jgi:hypothetical protein